MKRLCTILGVASVMLFSISTFSGCKKSSAAPTEDQPTATEKKFPIYSTDGSSAGVLDISKQPDGNARVVIELDKAVLKGTPPFKPMFLNSGTEGSPLVLAVLNNVNTETGVSETNPVISVNRGLPFSYDAIMFTRVLKISINDADNKTIVFTQLH